MWALCSAEYSFSSTEIFGGFLDSIDAPLKKYERGCVPLRSMNGLDGSDRLAQASYPISPIQVRFPKTVPVDSCIHEPLSRKSIRKSR